MPNFIKSHTFVQAIWNTMDFRTSHTVNVKPMISPIRKPSQYPVTPMWRNTTKKIAIPVSQATSTIHWTLAIKGRTWMRRMMVPKKFIESATRNAAANCRAKAYSTEPKSAADMASGNIMMTAAGMAA